MLRQLPRAQISRREKHRLKALAPHRLSVARRSWIGIAAVSGVLVLWWTIAGSGIFPVAFLPGPIAVAEEAVEMFLREAFLLDVAVSSARIAVAFLVSALLAIPIGVLMSIYPPADAAVSPIVDFVRYIPVPALLPLFVLWSGIGEEPKFLVLFVGTFFQLVLLIRDDADEVPKPLFEVARTMGADRLALIRHVLLPHIAPVVYDRLRITLGWCWTYLVIAELIAVQKGVGYIIKEAQRFNASDRMFVAFLVLGLIGLLTDVVARVGFRRLFPYVET